MTKSIQEALVPLHKSLEQHVPKCTAQAAANRTLADDKVSLNRMPGLR